MLKIILVLVIVSSAVSAFHLQDEEDDNNYNNNDNNYQFRVGNYIQDGVANNNYQFRVAKYFGSDMVLQSGGAKIYGWGGPGADVQVKVGNTTKETKVKSTGEWSVNVDLPPGGPYNITLIHRWTHLPSTIHLTNILFGSVWLCAGSTNMAVPMVSITNASQEISASLKFQDVRFARVAPAWTEEPQLDLLSGLSMAWQAPSSRSLSKFSATCWLYGRGLHQKLGVPVGVVGVYTEQAEMAVWLDVESCRKCKVLRPEIGWQHQVGLWNAMLFPLTNSSATGGIWYGGQYDVEDNIQLDKVNCSLTQFIVNWRNTQHLKSIGIVGLGGSSSRAKNSSWSHYRLTQERVHDSFPFTWLTPSLDLTDPGHHLSGHKLELANRLVNMSMDGTNPENLPTAPTIKKSCYVYIYIALTMTENVTANGSFANNGFSSCCRKDDDLHVSCADNGPNGDIEVLSSGYQQTISSFLFAQGCNNNTGRVTEVYYGWAGGYPHGGAPLYGATSRLPATTSFAPVIVDHHDPMCVH